jgi:DNA-binding phage protein
MTLFKTTDEQRVQRAVIAVAMRNAGLPTHFIGGWMELSDHDKGVFELGELWYEESDEDERDELVAAIQELLDEAAELPSRPIEKPRIGFGKLDDVADSIVEHKRRLREMIDRDHGGVSAAAAKIGMPQPSLSRFLSSASMPRRTTLYRIARGLGLDESAIVTEWVR